MRPFNDGNPPENPIVSLERMMTPGLILSSRTRHVEDPQSGPPIPPGSSVFTNMAYQEE
jgi:hypothetical protein